MHHLLDQRGGAVEKGEGGPTSRMISVTDLSEVGEARRAADRLGEEAGLDHNERGVLAIVTSEVTTNLARYAQGGMLALRIVGTPDAGGVEVLGLDRGPGITDLGRAMRDGYSSGGTSGHGLGAMRRMASEFDVTSSPAGTALVARVWSAAGLRRRRALVRTEGVVCAPITGEHACGDGWLVEHTPGGSLLVIADGLGHGVEAAYAADTALRIVRERLDATPAQLIQAAHGAMRSTRGAAMAIARLDAANGEIRFAGVGNIAGSIVTPDGAKSMASHNGTVGHTMAKVTEFTYACPAHACIIMHSDGVQTRWRLDAYPGLVARHPALVAGVLHRDFLRGRDDATVLVVRAQPLSDSPLADASFAEAAPRA